jgi:hypothetical protein
VANAIVPQEAEVNWLVALITYVLGNSYMHLLGYSITVSPTTTYLNLVANEASFSGYAPAALTGWSDPDIDGSGAASSTSSSALFTNTGAYAILVYGMYVTDSGPTQQWGCETYSSPISIGPGLSFLDVLTFTVLSRY